MPITLDGSLGVTTPMYNGTITANAVTPSVNMKNRIINGAMTVSQRNGTSTVTPASGDLTLDRWKYFLSQSSKLTVAQSTTAPAGFGNSMLVTSTSAYTVGASELFIGLQNIEGFNTYDLAWGTASAKTVTLSFQVYSSLTGTFGGSILNGSYGYSYPFTYSIPAANTWTTISVTIAGPTAGTWVGATNGIGLAVCFGFGVGSTNSGTAGSWSGNTYYSATGATSLVGTNGATFYITGVQLEVGSTATSFDYRPYTTELQLCQRYLPAWRFDEDNPEYGFSGQAGSATGGLVILPFLVQTRTRPTGIVVSNATHFQMLNAGQTSGLECSAVTFNRSSKYSVMVGVTCASGLTAGDMSLFSSKNTSAVIYATGCEL